jgi:hypothetical protein
MEFEVYVSCTVERNSLLIISVHQRRLKGGAQAETASTNTDMCFILEIVGIGNHFGWPLRGTVLADAYSTVATMAGSAKDSKVTLADKTARRFAEWYHFGRRIRNSRLPCFVLGRKGKRLEILVGKSWILGHATLIRVDGRDPEIGCSVVIYRSGQKNPRPNFVLERFGLISIDLITKQLAEKTRFLSVATRN